MTDHVNGQFCQTELLAALTDISNMCIGTLTMGYKLDPEHIGELIHSATGLTNPELNNLVKFQLKKDENPSMAQEPRHTACPKCLIKSYSLGDMENAWCGRCGDYRKSQLHIDFLKTLVDKHVEERGAENVRVEIHVVNRENKNVLRVASLSFLEVDTGQWERQAGYYATGHSEDFSDTFGQDYDVSYVKGISGTLVCFWQSKYRTIGKNQEQYYALALRKTTKRKTCTV